MLSLDEIQPLEDYLDVDSVDYFMKNSDRLFLEEPPITVVACDGQPFRYFAREGNSRLYVCYKLGISIDTVVPRGMEPDDDVSLLNALEAYANGIRKWSDLDGRMMEGDERAKYYRKKFGQEGI